MNQLTTKEQPQLPVAQAPATLLQVIERAALNPQVDIEKMERLMAMHERILARDSEIEFSNALTRAQSQMVRVAVDASNPQTRSKYATYAALDRALRPIYTAEGFSLSFGTENTDKPDSVRVICYCSHKSGHTRLYHIDVPADGKGAKGGDVMTKTHAVGSAMSYGMRYLLKAMFNVATSEDDDDGNRAGDAPKVTDEQAANIQCLAEEVGADTVAFFNYLSKSGKVQIDSFSSIPASMYKSAISALESKRMAQK